MIAVLVASSDDRKDIFDICFAHSERIWRDCDWPRYVGLTHAQPDQHGFKVVTSPQREWRLAVADYVDALPADIRYILLMVEDTLFIEPVDGKKLSQSGWWIASAKASYLRLVPITRNWFSKMLKASVCLYEMHFPVEQIPKSNPYYSSTEMAIWERGYLRGLLNLPANAWQFEHHISDREHYAVLSPVLKQHQIVQKGHWNRDAPRLLQSQGLSIGRNSRPFQTRGAWLRGKWQNINFAMFGFASVRIKQWLSS